MAVTPQGIWVPDSVSQVTSAGDEQAQYSNAQDILRYPHVREYVPPDGALYLKDARVANINRQLRTFLEVEGGRQTLFMAYHDPDNENQILVPSMTAGLILWNKCLVSNTVYLLGNPCVRREGKLMIGEWREQEVLEWLAATNFMVGETKKALLRHVAIYKDPQDKAAREAAYKQREEAVSIAETAAEINTIKNPSRSDRTIPHDSKGSGVETTKRRKKANRKK